MNGIGNHLLSRSVLSEYEHRSISGSYPFHCGEQFRHGLVVADDSTAIERGITRLLTGVETQGSLHPLQKQKVIPWFCDKVESSVTHTLYGKVYAPPGRDKNHRSLRLEYPHLPEERYPLLASSGPGIVHVHYDQVIIPCAYASHRLFWRSCRFHRVTGSLKQESERHPDQFIVIYYKNHDSKLAKYIQTCNSAHSKEAESQV